MKLSASHHRHKVLLIFIKQSKTWWCMSYFASFLPTS